MPPGLFFVLKIALAIWDLCDSVQILGLFYLYKNTIEISIGIALNLYIALGSMGHFSNIDYSNLCA